MAVRRAPAPFRLRIDVTTRLKAINGAVTLDGDPEHSGVQFRPANEVDRKATVYVIPKQGAQPHRDVDYPWVGATFTLDGRRHSVVELNHPDNPKQTRWSAYRDYGRLGAFAKDTIPSGQALVLKYAFLIAGGPMPAPEVIEKAWDQFAGVASPTPV